MGIQSLQVVAGYRIQLPFNKTNPPPFCYRQNITKGNNYYGTEKVYLEFRSRYKAMHLHAEWIGENIGAEISKLWDDSF